MTMDEKLFQVNGSLVGLYNPSAPAINPTGRLLFYLRGPFRDWPSAFFFFFAVVTNRCVLNVGATCLTLSGSLEISRVSWDIL